MFISYTKNLADLISSHQLKYHEFADDTQLIGRTEIPKVPSTIDSLQRCTADVDMPDVIICANFDVEQLRGLGYTGVKFWVLIEMADHLYNSAALPRSL